MLPETASAASKSRSPLAWYVAGAAAVALCVLAFAVYRHREAGVSRSQPVDGADAFDVRVRSEPAEALVTLDGVPVEGGVARRVPGRGAGELVAQFGCRRVVHRLDPSEAGTEIVLVVDPVEAEITVGTGLDDARVRWNGRDVGRVPAALHLDLCTGNLIEIEATGFRTARIEVRAGATPLEARTAVDGVALETLQRGRIRLPESGSPVTWLVDGVRARPEKGSLDVVEGSREVRAVNERLWIDVRARVEVPPGGEVRADVAIPPVASVEVQAFPSNCAVFLRNETRDWRHVDDTPAALRLAAGTYRIRVRHEADGNEQERQVRLVEGHNPPLRFSFARGRS